MLKLIGHIRPAAIEGVALSGGVDSMALLSFLQNHRSQKLTAYFFDHGTITSKKALEFVTNYCFDNYIPLIVGTLSDDKPPQDSWEEFWRNQRYGWLHSKKKIIATAHHLNDVAETYIWGMAHGRPRFIHYQKPMDGKLSNIIRPLLITPKTALYSWCERHQVPYIDDESNKNVQFTRNRIRQNIMPEMLEVNPGFLKTVERAWKDFFKFDSDA